MSLHEMIQKSPIAAVLTSARAPDNPIIACNEAFLDLTGYGRDEIIGRNCRFLAGSGTEPAVRARMRESIERERPIMVELLNYRKDGTPFRNAVMIAPIFDEMGDLQYFLGSQVEVADTGETRRQAMQARLAVLTPRQREVLLGMAAGNSSKRIAFELGLSERTIKMHRAALLRSLGVGTSVEAIRVAIEAGH